MSRDCMNDKAVSPVIGVILLVAITIIIAVVLAATVIGFGENLNEFGSASVSVSENTISLIDKGNGDQVLIRDSNGNNVGSLNVAGDQFTPNSEGTYQIIVEKDGIERVIRTISISSVSGEPFVMTVSASSFTVKTGWGTFDYDVDCNYDGSFDATDRSLNGDYTCDYNSNGEYKVAIKGQFPHMRYEPDYLSSESAKIVGLEQWGSIEWESMYRTLAGTKNIVDNTNDKPDLSNVNSMEEMFFDSEYDGDVSGWDTSNVEDMRHMFNQAYSFNGTGIGTWDTSSATRMDGMFTKANEFNADISGWDVSNVRSMEYMFRETSFNHDISGWDVSNVNDMSAMFQSSPFNQDLNSWDTSSVTEMNGMFNQAGSFNGGIGSWDVSNVEYMNAMFSGASNFNQSIDSWNTTSSINMKYMFEDASSFDQNISSWCVEQFSSEPEGFDTNSGFEGETSKHPNWGETC